MGLDVSYCRNATCLGDALADESESEQFEDEHPGVLITKIYLNCPDHAFQQQGLRVNEWYSAEASDWSEFRAGSYGGYNQWRNDLAIMAHGVVAQHVWETADYEGLPFYELINFSDCEGTIGPLISAKLAADFEQFKDMGLANYFSDEWGERLYRDFMKAFSWARHDGFVEFH